MWFGDRRIDRARTGVTAMPGWPAGRGYSPSNSPSLRRLVDLTALGWDTLVASEAGLEIGATCTIRDLYALVAPDHWRAAPLFATSCEAFLASFKVWNSATVGGNICMSLPAGPMITMTVALEATYTLWAADGSERTVDAADFVTGNHGNILGPGEILRRIEIPISALRKRHTHRRFTLTQLGRSTMFMIATQSTDTTDLLLTVTAGTTKPVRLAFRLHAGRRDAPAEHRRDTRRRVVRRPERHTRTTAVTWRSTLPRRSGSSSAQECWS